MEAGMIDVMWGYIKGLDWESTYPYLSMFQKDEDIDGDPIKIDPVTNYFVETPLNPVHWFNNQEKSSCPTGLFSVSVKDRNDTTGFG